MPLPHRRDTYTKHADERPASQAAPRGVLLVTSHFPPERGAGVHRMLRIVRHLHQAGWPVTVLTMDPESYRPGTPVDDRLLSGVPEGVTVYRTTAVRAMASAAHARARLRAALARTSRRLFKAPPTGTARLRAVDRTGPRVPPRRPLIDAEIGWLAPAVREGRRVLSRHPPDIILSSAPPFTCHLIAAALAVGHKAHWVADFRDPWARAPWGAAELGDSWRGRMRRTLERMVIERADAVILNTPLLHDDFAKHYGLRMAAKFHTVTNAYDTDLLIDRLRPMPRPSSRLVLTHTGSLYRQRDPRPLVEAFASAIAHGRVPADGIELNFVGAVSPEFALPQAVERLGLGSTVHLTPSVSHERSLQYLADADVLVVIQPGTHLQVPVKLYEYLPFRKPILALSPPGALQTIIDDGRLGLVVSPDDPRALEDAVCELYRHRSGLGRRFRALPGYIDQFEGTAVSRRLQRVLEEL
jgi:glycosyltransferase involved in cell wall biosynthesis